MGGCLVEEEEKEGSCKVDRGEEEDGMGRAGEAASTEEAMAEGGREINWRRGIGGGRPRGKGKAAEAA